MQLPHDTRGPAPAEALSSTVLDTRKKAKANFIRLRAMSKAKGDSVSPQDLAAFKVEVLESLKSVSIAVRAEREAAKCEMRATSSNTLEALHEQVAQVHAAVSEEECAMMARSERAKTAASERAKTASAEHDEELERVKTAATDLGEALKEIEQKRQEIEQHMVEVQHAIQDARAEESASTSTSHMLATGEGGHVRFSDADDVREPFSAPRTAGRLKTSRPHTIEMQAAEEETAHNENDMHVDGRQGGIAAAEVEVVEENKVEQDEIKWLLSPVIQSRVMEEEEEEQEEHEQEKDLHTVFKRQQDETEPQDIIALHQARLPNLESEQHDGASHDGALKPVVSASVGTWLPAIHPAQPVCTCGVLATHHCTRCADFVCAICAKCADFVCTTCAATHDTSSLVALDNISVGGSVYDMISKYLSSSGAAHQRPFASLPSVVTWIGRGRWLHHDRGQDDTRLVVRKTQDSPVRGCSPFIPPRSARAEDEDEEQGGDVNKKLKSELFGARVWSSVSENEPLSNRIVLHKRMQMEVQQPCDQRNDEEPFEGYAADVSMDLDRPHMCACDVLATHHCARCAGFVCAICATCADFVCATCAAKNKTSPLVALDDIGVGNLQTLPSSTYGSSNMTLLQCKKHLADKQAQNAGEGVGPRGVGPRGASPLALTPLKTLSRSSKNMSQKLRPSTTFIEEELIEVLQARKTRTNIKYLPPSRPPTKYIEDEVREILAARQNQGRHQEPIASTLPLPAVWPKKHPKRRQRAHTGRYVKAPDDRDTLERDARILRKELQSLDSKMMLREHLLRTRRRKTLDTRKTHEVSPADMDGVNNKSAFEYTAHSQLSLPQIDQVASPSSIASHAVSISASALRETQTGVPGKTSLEKSCSLLQQTPLSVINKHWYKSRDEDILYLLLQDEEETVQQAIQATNLKINRKKYEQEREAAKFAEEAHQKAFKIAKNPNKAEIFKAEADQTMTGRKQELDLVRDKARQALQHFHVCNEITKWEKHLTPQQETELAARRYTLKLADEALERSQALYEKEYQEAFIQAAERHVTMKRRLEMEATMKMTELHALRAVEIGFLHARDEEDGGSETQFITNHLFAATSHHVRNTSLDFISSMFKMHQLLKVVGRQDQAASLNVQGLAEYVGQWVGGKAQGVGVQMLNTMHSNGNRYEGQFSQDLRHGLGALLMREGGVMYEGMWWRGKRHGFGVESYLLKGAPDALPVAFVQFEEGRRKTVVRFDLESDLHRYLLHSVREIRYSARALAREARSNQLFKGVLPEPKRRALASKNTSLDITMTYSMPGTGKSFEGVGHDSIFMPDSSDSGQDLQDEKTCSDDESLLVFHSEAVAEEEGRERFQMRIRKVKDKKRKQEAKQAEREAHVVSVQHQRAQLGKIDVQVDDAMKDLKRSTSKAFADLQSVMKSAGMKTGKLYGLSYHEKRTERAKMPKFPTVDELKVYLAKQGVNEELAQRMADIYVKTHGPGANGVAQARRHLEQVRMGVLLDLSTGSDWHSQENGGIVIRKRYTGIRARTTVHDGVAVVKRESDGLEHMPASVLKHLMPSIRSAVISLPTLAKSGIERRTGTGASGAVPCIQDFAQAAKISLQSSAPPFLNNQEATPSIITVPMDMPFDVAIATFKVNQHKHIFLMPGTYKINGTLVIEKSVHIVGEDGARVTGKWRLKGDGAVSSIKNVHLEYQAKQDSTDFERLLHIDKGQVLLQDCALLCPRGYCLWADGRSVVNVLGCILAGSADGQVSSQATAVVMNFRSCTSPFPRMRIHTHPSHPYNNTLQHQIAVLH